MCQTRIAVVGGGAVGATFAAAAERAGHAVALCVRGATTPPVVELPGAAEHAFAGRVVAEPGGIDGPVEWVLLAVKSHQTVGAAGWLATLCGPATTVVVLQNGVEHSERVAPLAGPATVLPSVVWSSSERTSAGRVRQRAKARLTVPDVPAGRELAALFGAAAAIVPVEDFRTEAWRKLCMNAIDALKALTGRRGEVLHDPRIRDVARRLAEECVAVARAEGARLDVADGHAVLAEMLAMPPDQGTSILADRLAGRPLEWDARNDVIRRLGARHGIPTPVSDVLVALLAALDP